MDIEQETANLKDDVKAALSQDGILDRMKAQMREYVLKVLRKEGCKGLVSINKKEISETPKGRMEYSLVRNYLQEHDLKYTTSVMDGEAGFENNSEVSVPKEPELPSAAMQRLHQLSEGKKVDLLSLLISDWISMVDSGSIPAIKPESSNSQHNQPPLPEEPFVPILVDTAAPPLSPSVHSDDASAEYSSINKEDDMECMKSFYF